MRKLLFLTILVLGIAGIMSAQSVVGTAHDMSANETDGKICVFCHFPHNAAPAVPLWNHTLSTNTMTAYDSATMDAVDNNNWAANGGSISGMCMSCHDGSVGLGSLVNNPSGGAPTNAATTMGAVPANLGTDLTNDHPVVFTYNTALAGTDGELNDPATTPAVSALLFGAGVDQVECASCHDVHNTPGISPFLVMSNAGSALCLTCHVK